MPKAKTGDTASEARDPNVSKAEAEGLLAAMTKTWPLQFDSRFKPDQQPGGKPLLAAAPEVRKQALLLLLDLTRTPQGARPPNVAWLPKLLGPATRSYARQMAGAILRGKLPFAAAEAERLFEAVAGACEVARWFLPPAGVIALAERMNEAGELSDAAKKHLERIGGKLEKGYSNAESQKLMSRLLAILGGGGGGAGTLKSIADGEAWSDRALADYDAMSARARAGWAALLTHAASASAAKPSNKWESAAKKLLQEVGGDAFSARVIEWFELVPKPRTKPWPHRHASTDQTDLLISGGNVDVLRGLAWMSALTPAPPSADVCRALGRLCETSLKKLPGMGPRLPKLANAAVYALGKIAGEDALGQLARLKTRVTFRTTLQQIEKALDEAAARLGVTKSDLEELGVPTYGFDESGARRETFPGGAMCELRVDGRKVVTTWTNDKGKVVKSPPANLKQAHADELKELKLAAADAEKMLTAQRDRIDSLMGVPKTWKLDDVRSRYLQHPLVGQIARRLIWVADDVPVLFVVDGGKAIDVKGNPVKFGKTAEVALWHPAGRSIGEIIAWRRRLEELQITQPFKQAHREVYLLTDAERNTRVYSNRFAAHVIRQHQFNALAAQRGWRNKLRLMVDDTYPPATKDLPAFGLRAEFWVGGIGDDYGTDTTDSGAYLRLSTDQVRFYRAAAAMNSAHASGGGYAINAAGPGTDGVNEPLPLESIPPLAFSEIMRDVDLFVGVASVGNDPTWQDGGPQGRYQTYWRSYSFGELTETAKTRRQVLESLLPRLTKLNDRWRLDDRFLVIRGDIRSYKIHLGSGNILMEPNDQYLCIVPARSAWTPAGNGDGKVFLPFEGDQTLSVILSKAFLLAEDAKITDPTILSQIRK